MTVTRAHDMITSTYAVLPDVHQRLHAYAADHDLTVGQVVRRAIAAYVAAPEDSAALSDRPAA